MPSALMWPRLWHVCYLWYAKKFMTAFFIVKCMVLFADKALAIVHPAKEQGAGTQNNFGDGITAAL